MTPLRATAAMLCTVGLVAIFAATAVPASAQSGQLVFNDKSQLCLEGASGRVAQIENCDGANNTFFHMVAVTGGDMIKNGYNQCLEVPSTSQGTEVAVGSCNIGWYNVWKQNRDGTTSYCWFTNTAANKVLGTEGGGTALGTDTVIWGYIKGHTDQVWTCF